MLPPPPENEEEKILEETIAISIQGLTFDFDSDAIAGKILVTTPSTVHTVVNFIMTICFFKHTTIFI